MSQYSVGTKCYHKGSPVEIVCNEDGYIVAKHPSGAEIDGIKVADLSMTPVQPPARLRRNFDEHSKTDD